MQLALLPAVADPQQLHNHPDLAVHANELAIHSRLHGACIKPIGVAPLNTQPRVFNPGVGGNPWTVTRLEDDPLIQQNTMAIPKTQRENLRRIVDAGIEFTELLIAHEHPPEVIASDVGWRELNATDLLHLKQLTQLPEPVEVRLQTRRTGDRIGYIARRSVNGVSWLAKTSGETVTATVKASGRAATGFAEALATLDPIIIGVTTASNQLNQGEPALYCVLARWDW